MSERPYQTACKAKIHGLIAQGERDMIVQLMTGLGKTRIMADLTRAEYLRGSPTLHIVPRVEIFDQTLAAYARLGVPVAALTAGKRPDLRDAMVVLAMGPTLARRADLGFDPRLVQGDEAHANLDQLIAVKRRFRRARFLWWTATPIRTDGRSLSLLSKNLLQGSDFGAEISDVTRDGYLVPCVTLRGPSPDLQGIRMVAGDYEKGETQRRHRRTALIGQVPEHLLRLAPGRRLIGFTTGREHSADLTRACKAVGLRAEHVDDSTRISCPDCRDWRSPSPIPLCPCRKGALIRLRTRRIDVLWNCGLFVEGLDAVEVDGIALCFSSVSLSKVLQCVGRGLRPSPATGKRDLLVFDFGGNTFSEMHGLPDEDRDWSLGGVPRRAREGGNATQMHCTVCLRSFVPAATCPGCGAPMRGARLPPPVVQVEIAPVSRAEAERRLAVESRAVAARPCPSWASGAEWLWHRVEAERVEHAYPVSGGGRVGFTEARVRRWLDGRQ